ncbi:MAG: hypothetical protein M0Z45_03660 [Actinomycetota bacterium]|nr:hypothetical protein [Actinomycetota bacterium]
MSKEFKDRCLLDDKLGKLLVARGVTGSFEMSKAPMVLASTQGALVHNHVTHRDLHVNGRAEKI